MSTKIRCRCSQPTRGYLCPLITKAGRCKANTDALHVRGGEFIADEVEALMDDASLVESACAEIVERTRDRRACLIFAAGVQHGEHIVETLKASHDIECGFVTGKMSNADRDAVLQRFKSGDLKYLCNVNVLTTGFDAPHIDCVALVRPTMSPGLYYQMVGRGFRLHPDKQDCLILDFGGNVLRHGPVDQIKLTTSVKDTSRNGSALSIKATHVKRRSRGGKLGRRIPFRTQRSVLWRLQTLAESPMPHRSP